jgi:hypothetical protein
MTAQRVGTTLLTLAKRFCAPQQIDAVILPMIADMQFETLAHAYGSPLVRGWVRVRGYVAFFKAVMLTVVLQHGRTPMESKALGWLRLLLAIPAALLVTVVVQYVVGIPAGYLLYSAGGVSFWRGGEFGGQLAKVIAMFAMALAFFWTVCFIVPRHRRTPFAAATLVFLGALGALAIYNGISPWPEFTGWKVATGCACWLGGTVSYWLTSRAGRAAAAA